MTTRRDISLNVIADISKYQEQFAKIPGYTDKQAAKAAQALEKRMSKAAADSARTAERAAEKAAREAAKAANKAQREIIDTQREAIEAGKGLAELAGIPADKFEKLRAVMSGLSSPLGQLAVAGVGAALAIGGVATAIAGVSAAAVASVRASGELLEKFEKLSEVEGFDIPPEDVESIRRANAALDSIQVTAERLVVIFAGQMAPSVEAVSVEIVKLGLAAGDVLDGMGSAAVLVGNIFGKLGRTVVTGIAPATGALLEMASVSASIARAAGFDDLAERFEAISDAATDIPFEVVSLGFEGISIATSDYDARARQLIGTVRTLAEEEEKEAESAKKATDQKKKQEDQIKAIIAAGEKRNAQVDRDIALQKQNAAIIADVTRVELSAMGRLAQATEEQLAAAKALRQERLQNARGDYFLRQQAEIDFQEAQTAIVEHYEEERSRIMDEEADARTAAMIDQENNLKGAREKFAAMAISSAAQSTATISRILADRGQKKRAREAFRIAKAFNIAMVTMETVRAARGALLPPPAGFGAVLGPAAAGLIAASGAVQVAAIAMQKPPTFYRGTSNVQADGGAADAVPAVLHQGEAVLNRRAADSMGRGNIDDMNAGRRRGSPPVVAISQINHRQFRDFYRDDRSLPGSLTRRDRNRNGTKIGRQL